MFPSDHNMSSWATVHPLENINSASMLPILVYEIKKKPGIHIVYVVMVLLVWLVLLFFVFLSKVFNISLLEDFPPHHHHHHQSFIIV